MAKTDTQKPGLRMKELCQATGVPKSTILHYLQLGLLPQPRRTRPNLAYYDPSCVERVRLIRHLQRHHRLSLAEIGEVLARREGEADWGLFLELQEQIFPEHEDETWDREEFLRATGLEPERLDQLLEARLLLPLVPGRYDRWDLALGRIYAWGAGIGVKVEDIRFYAELGERIVEREMALRRRLTHHLSYGQDASITMEMVKAARATRAYVIDRLFQHRVASQPDLKEGE